MRDTTLRAILATPEGAIGAGILVLAAALALAAPVLSPGDPLAMIGRPLLTPFTESGSPLGTDRLGRDIAAGILHGARESLLTALTVAAVALLVGSALGTIAGYLGGLVDEFIMRIADAVQTVPSFLLALAIVSAAGPSATGVIAALAASAWTAPARIVRAEVLSLRQLAFVDASRLFGRHPLAIAFSVVLPNALAPVIALAAIIVAGAILAESALAFLGLADPNHASWGAMIAEGRSVLRTAPHVILAPGLALLLTVLAVSLLGEGVAKAIGHRS